MIKAIIEAPKSHQISDGHRAILIGENPLEPAPILCVYDVTKSHISEIDPEPAGQLIGATPVSQHAVIFEPLEPVSPYP